MIKQLQPTAVIKPPSHQPSEVGDPCDSETSVPFESREAAVSIVADGPISGEAQLHEIAALKEQNKEISNINANSLRVAEESQVADADQTLRGALYTGNCRSEMCPAVNVPKCLGKRVSFVADSPISGEECLDCAFVQACNTTQWLEANSEQVGGTGHSREQVVGYSAMLSTVGMEFSSLVETFF